jgi:hypothetical protein
MTVTPKIGMFRARGDQWGTVSGSTLRPENPNLLTLTEKMARAIQVYLQRQGYTDLTNVEAILLCSEPTTTVDSMRPIIRVIMRDTLERFAASIMQARIVLSPESAFNIVNRLLNPPPPPPSKPVESAAPAAEAETVSQAQPSDPTVPAFAMPGSASVPASTGESVPPVPQAASPAAPRPRARFRLTRNQIILLVVMVVIWCLIIVGLAFLIAMNLNPPLIMLK